MTSSDISDLISKLNNNCAPGIDGLTTEHLSFGKSEVLCKVLAALLSNILSWQMVPDTFQIGLIIPVLKRPSLNPNDVSSFRPITLSSALSKLLELLLLPKDSVNNNQYGFRQGRGTSFACSLFNDTKRYIENECSPLFACSFDAEKCFDSNMSQISLL